MTLIFLGTDPQTASARWLSIETLLFWPWELQIINIISNTKIIKFTNLWDIYKCVVRFGKEKRMLISLGWSLVDNWDTAEVVCVLLSEVLFVLYSITWRCMHQNDTHVWSVLLRLAYLVILLVMKKLVGDVYFVPPATLLFLLRMIWSFTVSWPSMKSLYTLLSILLLVSDM